jgi:hypothetical protein
MENQLVNQEVRALTPLVAYDSFKLLRWAKGNVFLTGSANDGNINGKVEEPQ